MKRRTFLKGTAAAAVSTMTGCATRGAMQRRPNIVYVFADQWRAQATGYNGDPNAQTPNMDRLAATSLNLCNAVSNCPVCSPYRGTLLTGQYPDRHGVFLNDVCLRDDGQSLAQVLHAHGYDTAYVGKWHLDGHGRSAFIPRERRQGWDFWRVLECTHNYNASDYYGDAPEKLRWDGYDAIAQTREAQRYLREHARSERPFTLFLSWGPPHNPYETAPETYRNRFGPETLILAPNVPESHAAQARTDLAGYYAHIAALDDCVGLLWTALRETGLEENTIFVLTSDHGDMLGSQGQQRKQRPWDESIRVPFLLRYPAGLGDDGRKLEAMFGTTDILPTLLELCGLPVPAHVQGLDHTPVLLGRRPALQEAALIACYSPFGEWTRAHGGREYRGVRTARYTYVRTLEGPWLLYDNEADPYQMKNCCGDSRCRRLQKELDSALDAKLNETADEFLPGGAYVKRFGYAVDATGTVKYGP